MIELAAQQDNLIFLAVSVDTNKQAITRFLKKQNKKYLNGKTTRIAWDKDKQISMDQFQVIKYPETILISPQGKMVDKIVGTIDWLSEDTKDRIKKASKL